MKKCKRCKDIDPICGFYVDKRNKGGLRNVCIKCNLQQNIEWIRNNREKSREYARNFRSKNGVKMKVLYKKWRDKSKEKRNEYNKKYRLKNKERLLQDAKRYRETNSEKVKLCRRKGMGKIRNTPEGRLNHSMSSGIYASLVGMKHGYKWERLVGYSLKELRVHLERLFCPDMTWNNYGQWHVDHKVPKAIFSFLTSKDPAFQKCWELNNLQPLWAKDNLSKGVKYEM